MLADRGDQPDERPRIGGQLRAVRLASRKSMAEVASTPFRVLVPPPATV